MIYLGGGVDKFLNRLPGVLTNSDKSRRGVIRQLFQYGRSSMFVEVRNPTNKSSVYQSGMIIHLEYIYIHKIHERVTTNM